MAEDHLTASADPHWHLFMDAADSARLNSQTIAQLGRGAALLLRVAKVSHSADARAAERWLATMVFTAALACAGLQDVQ